MMGNPISNNTACVDLHQGAYETCRSMVQPCKNFSSGLSTATQITAIPMIALAGALVADSALDSYHIIKSILEKSPRKEKNVFDNRLCVNQDQKHKTEDRVPSIWTQIFSPVKKLAAATAITTLALVILESGKIVSEEDCESLESNCPKIALSAVKVCNWGNKFLIDIIRQLLPIPNALA